jgi:CheY-like chemotaxis protein
MVVEDDANVRLLACEVLRHSGYRVMECPDPAHAIREVESAAAPIHLLLTDMVMPEMDGRELYQHLSKLLPELKVVYMSGSSVDALLEGVERRERAPFVKKPFTIQVLARAVRAALDR